MRDKDTTVNSQERRWVLGFALAVMLVTTLPYLLGYAMEGENWRFTGFVLGVEDGNSYIAKMLSGGAGDWLFRTPYTATPQRGVMAFFPYLLLGKLSAPPAQHEQLAALYHLYRIGAGVLAMLATYDFLAIFLKEMRLRRWGLALVSLGGGLGWVLAVLGQGEWLGSLPLDFISPESFGFLAFYTLPHLLMARALFLWGLVKYLNVQTFKRYNVQTGLLWLVMGFFQPLTIVVAWAVLGAHLGITWLHGLWRMRRGEDADWPSWRGYLRRAVITGLISAPMVVYTWAAFNRDPFLKAWTAQNLVLSPPPLHYLVAYGLALPFAAAGAIRLLRRGRMADWLPVAWVLSLPLLAYAPYNLQRRLPEGIWVAVVVLALTAFEGKERPVRLFPRFGPLLLAFPTTLFLLLGGVLAVLSPDQPLFRPADEVAAFLYLDAEAVSGGVVLTAYETGNALPAWAAMQVVIGHGPESANLDELRPRVAGFYQIATTDAERRALLDEFGVRYVFWGPQERELGGWDPYAAAYLREVFAVGDYVVFVVGE